MQRLSLSMRRTHKLKVVAIVTALVVAALVGYPALTQRQRRVRASLGKARRGRDWQREPAGAWSVHVPYVEENPVRQLEC